MESEIKIILEDGTSNKAQGTCFENLIRNILSSHQYEVKSNINFTGMEIDLLASHKIRKESLYVECKAKDKVSSTEIRNFAFNVQFKNADFGYFIRTKEIDAQAGGLIDEMKKDNRYKNLTFIEPVDVIQILVDAGRVIEPHLPSNLTITKRILCVTFFGEYLLFIVTQSSVIPTNYILFDAQNGTEITDIDIIDKIVLKIDEISQLKQLVISNNRNEEIYTDYIKNEEIETISEVQESEHWYDYLPASSKHFVGRDKIRISMFDFFNNVLNSTTKRRVFYLTGKSGWGKSSLVAEIRGRCRNKHYKKKYFAYAVDTRSATSQNFVALAFKELIHKAQKESFLGRKLAYSNLNFTSNFDLLSSESVKEILEELEREHKILILIFDQFEDVFRKNGLFKSFYKFLSDITDLQTNIIVGFSWKTEILIPSENEAYHYWQQAKEQAELFTVPEFGAKEIDGVIYQLENSVKRLGNDLKRRIKENSQGLPWLTKKLCIHIYEQIQSGVKPDKLIDENLNIEELFKSDLEKINSDEASALKYIAKRAYDGNFFDISELGEVVSESAIESLRDKRLIIRSGVHYNIYWDIFRDYLVNGEVPVIGESYILRQGVNLCIETFLLFPHNQETITMGNLLKKYPRSIGKTTLENILIELRNIGIVHKIENEEKYRIAINIEITKEAFVEYINNKFTNYTPFQKMEKKADKKIGKDEIIEVLKETFKYDFKDKTWDTYANNLIRWLQTSNLPLKEKVRLPLKGNRAKKGIKNRNNIVTLSARRELEKQILLFLESNSNISKKAERDLYFLQLIDENGVLTQLGSRIFRQGNISIIMDNIRNLINELPKVKYIKGVIHDKNMPVKEICKLLPIDFFGKVKDTSKLVYLSSIVSWLR